MDGATEPYRDVFTGVFWESLPHIRRHQKDRLQRGLSRSFNNPNHWIVTALRNRKSAVELNRVMDGSRGKAAAPEVLSSLLVVQEVEADITAGNRA